MTRVVLSKADILPLIEEVKETTLSNWEVDEIDYKKLTDLVISKMNLKEFTDDTFSDIIFCLAVFSKIYDRQQERVEAEEQMAETLINAIATERGSVLQGGIIKIKRGSELEKVVDKMFKNKEKPQPAPEGETKH